jgi:predicted DNA-binding protein
MSTTVRVTDHTHQVLRELAEEQGKQIQTLLEEIVERYRREQFFRELDEAYEKLQADPAAWADYLAEREELEGTLADGLDDV